ncbi:MAG: serine--tRNA ligase [Epsilonproteobacteria bacterium]|nr:MAG: serine--tRNA ligase [Campylobacterota bacterium]RLA64197.1 MAG: serine--tRNA ligase [Campylobacterota bacterium]
MHDIKFFEANTAEVKENLKKRNVDISLVDKALDLNAKRKELTKFVEDKRAEVKSISKEIGLLKKEGKDASHIMSQVAEIKSSIEGQNLQLDETEKELNATLSVIPNLLSPQVPVGTSEEENALCKEWGTPKEFSFKAKDHVALGENLDMLDFERGAKITGARFVVYKKGLARLERALINYMLDEHGKNGYDEIIPPFIVNAESLYGTGQLPKFEEDLFKLNHEDKQWYLIPTAEVPVTNLRRGELFSGDELPLKYCAYTPCFRSEAGSYGKDTRGLIRLHQFNKVELVEIVAPEDSDQAHEDMIHRACSILEALNLPYKTMLLCSGDIGFGASICFDLEVWLPGQQKYREISSLSNCRDFQARRAGIRFRDKDGKPQFAHTLNGSGLAVGRTVVAIMENYQREDGTIEIPEVLRSYMGGQEIIS